MFCSKRAHSFAIFLLATAFAQASQENLWPFSVVERDDASGQVIQQSILGPIGFSKEQGSKRVSGVRPLFHRSEDSETGKVEGSFLFPLFNWSSSPEETRWDIFKLVNSSSKGGETGTATGGFDVWPFYFSRNTGDPGTSYRAFMPVKGTIKNRFGNDRIEWVAFPFYGRFEKGDMVTTTTPWPFVKHVSGAGHRGFELWPFFGWRSRDGDYSERFAVWPLYHDVRRDLSEEIPTEEFALLPFYSRSRSAKAVSETYAWPFFGYTRSKDPEYFETRWFWPFAVQSRGADRHVDRWAPFYTHSLRKGVEKTWVLWPAVRQQSWTDDGLAQEKFQFLYFLIWDLKQSSASNPSLPAAHKTHIWPLVSSWDNGAGRSQIQLLSPLEVFFPNNEKVRTLYSPLFAVFRHDRRSESESRSAFLFDFVTLHRKGGESRFNLGPLLEVRRDESGLQRLRLFRVIPLYSAPKNPTNSP